jgi:hypothetical protein
MLRRRTVDERVLTLLVVSLGRPQARKASHVAPSHEKRDQAAHKGKRRHTAREAASVREAYSWLPSRRWLRCWRASPFDHENLRRVRTFGLLCPLHQS